MGEIAKEGSNIGPVQNLKYSLMRCKRAAAQKIKNKLMQINCRETYFPNSERAGRPFLVLKCFKRGYLCSEGYNLPYHHWELPTPFWSERHINLW